MRRTPEPMRAVVSRCLEKSLERRYQSVAELARDLVPFASDPISAARSADTCARLLERRKSNALSAPLEKAEPISGTPPPLTPHSRLPMPQEMVSATHQVNAKSDRRWLVISASFLIACAIGGAAVLYTTQRSTEPPPAPAAAPVETKPVVEPKPAEPAKPAPVETPAAETKPNAVDFDERASFDSAKEPETKPAPAVETKPAPTIETKPEPVAETKPIAKPKPVAKPKPRPIAKPKPKPDDDPFSRR